MTGSSHIALGKIGEELAAKYLKKHGFHVIERNYRKKLGEIDIVAEKDGVLHFVEVKSAECAHFPPSEGKDRHRPEDHMHYEKCRRMKRAIETYLHERRRTGIYTADLVVVYVNTIDKRAKVHVLWDVLL